MTEDDMALLRSLCQVESLTLLPEGTSPAALRRFDDTVGALQRLKRAGWIELEVSLTRRKRSGRVAPGKYRGAVARCTEEGRRAIGTPGG